MSFRARLVETADTMLSSGRPKIDDIVNRAVNLYAAEFSEEGQVLAWRASRRMVTEYLRSLDREDDGQESLPGIEGMPRAICVGDYYVSTVKATWAELEAGLEQREQNIASAIVRRDDYLRFMDRVRARMSCSPSMTVEQALALEVAA